MRVLHVVSDLGQGGAQSYVCDLIKHHANNDELELTLLALFFKGALWERVEKLGIPMTCIGMKHAFDVIGLIKLRKYLRSQKYDVIHVHHIHPAISALIAGLPSVHVYTEHGGGLLGGGWMEKLIYQYFHKSYCRFIAISKEMKKCMSSVNRKIEYKHTVVYNGVDIEAIDRAVSPKTLQDLGVDETFTECVGIIGRLEHQKGVCHFVEVARKVALAKTNVVFLVIGEGSLRIELEELARSYNLQDRMIFLGFRDDAIAILKLFTVFLFTSEYEPFGLVITEAMAAGVPVVAMHGKGAVPEIIDDGVDGFIVNGCDYERLAEKTSSLLNDLALRNKIVSAARKKVEDRFSMENNARIMLDIYKECLMVKQ